MMEQEETTGNTEINSLDDLMRSKVFNVMYWREGMGWAVTYAEKSIEEARKIKSNYLKTNQQARIFMEVE